MSRKSLILQISRSVALVFILVLLILPTKLSAQFYQGYQTEFGKNRVQYNDFLWTFYRFRNFDTYFYVGGKELAQFVGKNAGKEIESIEGVYDFKTNGRLQFIIFNKYSDFKQSNIGLEFADVSINTGGYIRVRGNQILLFFNGDHAHFIEQIRAGTAQVLLQQLMYGGNIKDRVQSAMLLNIPPWYEKGLVSYLSKGWGVEEDNHMRDGVLSGKYKRFNRLMEGEDEFAGHSMWHYIVQTYGITSVANLLYLTRVNRSIEGGFKYVLGVDMKRLTENWISYYQKLYESEEKDRVLPPGDPVWKKTKPATVITHLRLSPDGSKLSFVTNNIGKYRIRTMDLRTGKTKKIAKGGYRSNQQKPDLSFPLIAWHPSGQFLTVMREKKGKIWMDYYKPGKRKPERNKFFYFDKVLDFAYSPSGQEIVLSGVQKGQSDIYVFSTRSRSSVNLTDDVNDDLQPTFSEDGKKIYFVSNRVNDTLGVFTDDIMPANSNLDVFSMDYPSFSGQVLKRITNTPLANETRPIAADSGRIVFISDANGIANRYVATVDSTISFIDTTEHYRFYSETAAQSNYSRNVDDHSISRSPSRYAELIYNKGSYRMMVNPPPIVKTTGEVMLKNTSLRQLTAKKYVNERKPPTNPKPAKPAVDSVITKVIQDLSQQDGKKPLEQPERVPTDTMTVDINNYVFQSEFMKPKPKKAEGTEQPAEPVKKAEEEKKQPSFIPTGKSVAEIPPDSFRLPKQRNYDLAFSSDYFMVQLDNGYKGSTYQVFTGGPFYFDPGLNVTFRMGVTEMMNDYKISGGFGIPFDLNSTNYFIRYDNIKNRIDQSFGFQRLGYEYVSGYAYYEVHSNEIHGQLRYPFNDLSSLRGSMSMRNDKVVTLATDSITLTDPSTNDYWASFKLEYVYDNTLPKGLNLYNGLRYKLFAETFRQLDRNKSWLHVVGIDIRNYLKVHRQIILASRFAASTSFGNEKLLYYLGSTDNAMVPDDNFNYSIPIDYSQNYAFQAISTNMRGFVQNIRNGNSFILINNELRVPLFQYLLNKPIRSEFIRNFQVVGFFDVGTAWNGPSPYSKSNSFNTEVIGGNPVIVVLDRQVDPIVAGFGGGMRCTVMGYFLRLDWGWGYEDGVVHDPEFYLSLGLDF